MTRRARPVDEAQLRLDLDERQHPAVVSARAVRRTAGLGESLTDAVVLGRVTAALRGEHPGKRAGRAANDTRPTRAVGGPTGRSRSARSRSQVA